MLEEWTECGKRATGRPALSTGVECWKQGCVQFWADLRAKAPLRAVEGSRFAEDGKPDRWQIAVRGLTRYRTVFEGEGPAQARDWFAARLPELWRVFGTLSEDAFAWLAAQDPRRVAPEDPERPAPERVLQKGADGVVRLWVSNGPGDPFREDPAGLARVDPREIEDLLASRDEEPQPFEFAGRGIDGAFRG